MVLQQTFYSSNWFIVLAIEFYILMQNMLRIWGEKPDVKQSNIGFEKKFQFSKKKSRFFLNFSFEKTSNFGIDFFFWGVKPNFLRKKILWKKIKFFEKNINFFKILFGENSNFWEKFKFLGKIQIFGKNSNFWEKFKFLGKIQIVGKKT